MKQEFKKNSLIMVIILSVIFGMSAGIVGGLIAKVYILEGKYNLPFFGEIDLSNGYYRGSNIIIRDAKKVVVEQNDKVVETINSVRGSLVGIYRENPAAEPGLKAKDQSDKFILKNYYKIGQEAAQGLIITSDGWVITNFLPDSMDYVIITQDKKVYSIDKIMSDTLTSFNFLHVVAKDLPVRKFAEENEINNGQIVLAVNWSGESLIDSIVNTEENLDSFLFFSDLFSDKVKLANDLSEKFSDSFLFNLSGDIVGLSDNRGEVEVITHFSGAINSLLKNKTIMRPSLGVNYIDLSKLVNAMPNTVDQDKFEQGALIYKNTNGISVVKYSSAEKAGLKDGDIIISIDGIEINKNNNLTNIVQRYIAGENINIVYLRDGEEKDVDIKLGEVE